MKKPIVVLMSGTGTNLKAIIERCTVAEVAGVISSTNTAPGIKIAVDNFIPCSIVDRLDFTTYHQYEQALINRIEILDPELIVLAGFMRILSPAVVEQFEGKIVNIHPSLLPAYRGLHTHRRVLDAREKKHGTTIHYVDKGLDTGTIIFQLSFDIIPGMDEDSLEHHVKSMEHIWYPTVIDYILKGNFSPC